MNGKEALLQAFDRLFDTAVFKLRMECNVEDKEEARRHFTERFAAVLDVASQIPMHGIPDDVMRAMEDAVEQLSPAQVAGHLAMIPLAHQTQEMLRVITQRAVQQRLLEDLIDQADDRYGGN